MSPSRLRGQAYAPEEPGSGDECRCFWFPDGKIVSASMRSAAVSLKDRQRRVRATSKAQRRASHRVGSSDQKATDLDRRLEVLTDLDRQSLARHCHRAAYSPGPYQPSVSSPLAPPPAQASPSSTSRLSYRTRTSDPIEPSALSCRVTCVKQQSRSVPTACARRRHDLSRQQTARRLEAQVAIGADSTAVRCAGLLLAMSNHTWVGTTSVNLTFPAERESARTSNALPHRTTSGTRRRRVSETALGQAKQRTGTPPERSPRACICTAASSLSRLWRSSKLRRLLVSPTSSRLRRRVTGCFAAEAVTRRGNAALLQQA